MSNECKISRWTLAKQTLNNLSPQAFQEFLVENPNAVLLDCRTPDEFEFGRLKNATNFDYLSRDMVGQIDKLDPEKTYLVYCRSERRSIRTCVLLRNGGIKKVYNLDGGLIAWVDEFGAESLERV